MILKRSFDLDVLPGGQPLIIRMSVNDSSSQLTFSLYASTGSLSLATDVQAFIRGKGMSADSTGLPCVFSLNDGTPQVTVQLSGEITEKKGKRPFELVLTRIDDGGAMHTLVTASFIFDVR